MRGNGSPGVSGVPQAGSLSVVGLIGVCVCVSVHPLNQGTDWLLYLSTCMYACSQPACTRVWGQTVTIGTKQSLAAATFIQREQSVVLSSTESEWPWGAVVARGYQPCQHSPSPLLTNMTNAPPSTHTSLSLAFFSSSLTQCSW